MVGEVEPPVPTAIPFSRSFQAGFLSNLDYETTEVHKRYYAFALIVVYVGVNPCPHVIARVSEDFPLQSWPIPLDEPFIARGSPITPL